MASKISPADEWWAGLTIAQKERIARKASSKAEVPFETTYPACSRWWITLDEAKKQGIHEHCTDRHGYLLADFQEGHTLSY